MKRLIPILLTTIIVVSTSARADLIDQVSNLKDKALGRVSLVCDTNKFPKKSLYGFYPNAKYNVVFQIRKSAGIIELQRYSNNKIYDELDGFTFRAIDDEYIYFLYRNEQSAKSEKATVILIDRYRGDLILEKGARTDSMFFIPWRTPIGECRHGRVKAKKKF